jgi:hypothetical protein
VVTPRETLEDSLPWQWIPEPLCILRYRHPLWDAVVVSDDAIDQASERYDRAERAYLTAVASGVDEAALRSLARDVALAAQSWESADNAADPPSSGVTRYYDPPEILSTLWRELADAYDRRAG